MIRLSPIIICLTFWFSHSFAQTSEMHYWFDQNFTDIQTQIIPSSPMNADINTTLDISTLPIGLHSVHFRFKDENGIFSSTTSHFFWKTIEDETPTAKQIVKYQYWFDNDFSSAQLSSISQTENFTLISDIDLSSLNIGLHSFNIRYEDNLHQWSSIKSNFFWKRIESEPINIVDLNSLEYWFDSNISETQTIPLSGQNSNWTESIEMSSLELGLHTFSYRVKDENMIWSSVKSNFFWKSNESEPINIVDLNSLEYWFDSNISETQTIPLSGQNSNWTESIEMSSLELGLHTFSYRVKDENMIWSSVKSNFFWKSNESEPINIVDLNSLEYWFDSNLSEAQTIPLSGQNSNWTDNINISSLEPGLHIFSYRVKDENMIWSSVNSNFCNIIQAYESLTNNPLKRFRYWLNDDFENNTILDINEESNNIIYIEDISFLNVSSNEYIFRYQFQDSIGSWSVPMFDTIQKELYPYISVMINENEFCGEGEFNVTYDTTDVSDIEWQYGDGESESTFTPMHTYTDAGTYHPMVSAYNETTGQTILYNLTDSIQVYPEFQTDSLRYICSNDSTLFQGNYYYESGIFEINHYTIHGCDSTFSLNLNLNPVNETLLTENICEGDSILFNGMYINESGNYQINLSNQYLCDSTVYMNLIVNPRPATPSINQGSDTLYTSEYESYYWYFNGDFLSEENDSILVCNENGDYFVIVENAYSCLSDSSEIISVILTEKQTGNLTEVSIYPNPVKDYVYIQMNILPEKSISYNLIGINGQVIKQGIITENKSYLNLSECTSGAYILLLNYDNQIQSVRLIKE